MFVPKRIDTCKTSDSSKKRKAKKGRTQKKSTPSTKKLNPLYTWMTQQRRCKRGVRTDTKNGGELSKEKIELLDRLGFDWNPNRGGADRKKQERQK